MVAIEFFRITSMSDLTCFTCWGGARLPIPLVGFANLAHMGALHYMPVLLS